MNRRARLAPAVQALVWVALLVAMIALLGRLGHGSLAGPRGLDRAELQQWAAQHDAATLVFALLRIGAMILAWYALGSTALGLAARATRVPHLVRAADLVTLPAVRRMLTGVAGVGLTASVGALALAPLPASARVPIPSDQPAVGQPAASTATMRVVTTATMRVVDARPAPSAERPPDTATMIVVDAPGRPAARPPVTTAPTVWTVRPGEHFWGEASIRLSATLGRPPTDREIADYCRVIVDHNRSRLADPDNPDLIFAGQQFELPAPPTT